jgi:hypothetical protein
VDRWCTPRVLLLVMDLWPLVGLGSDYGAPLFYESRFLRGSCGCIIPCGISGRKPSGSLEERYFFTP